MLEKWELNRSLSNKPDDIYEDAYNRILCINIICFLNYKNIYRKNGG